MLEQLKITASPCLLLNINYWRKKKTTVTTPDPLVSGSSSSRSTSYVSAWVKSLNVFEGQTINIQGRNKTELIINSWFVLVAGRTARSLPSSHTTIHFHKNHSLHPASRCQRWDTKTSTIFHQLVTKQTPWFTQTLGFSNFSTQEGWLLRVLQNCTHLLQNQLHIMQLPMPLVLPLPQRGEEEQKKRKSEKPRKLLGCPGLPTAKVKRKKKHFSS